MKVIDLDKVELNCLKWGIKNGYFTENDLKDKNLVTISITGQYKSKTCDVWIKGHKSNKADICESPITFTSKEWEDLYYDLNRFFSD